MDYLSIKHLHMSLAAISIAGFVLRWVWRMNESPLSQAKTVRILPHVVDTLLLLSAGFMVVITINISGQVPLGMPWLSAKISGLLIYILLGILAMRSAPDKARSVPAFLAALLAFGWIISVAFGKSPTGFFDLL